MGETWADSGHLSFVLIVLSLLALALWTDIDRLNTRLAETLAALSELYEQDASSYTTALKYIASLQPIQVSLQTFCWQGKNLMFFLKWSANPYQPEEEKPIITKFYDAHKISWVSSLKKILNCGLLKIAYLGYSR